MDNRSTLQDVARVAGVSLATVDRVINKRPGVRHQTAERVQEVIRELNFQRDPLASRLARVVSHRLLFLLPPGNNRFMRTIEAQVALAAREFTAQRVFADVELVDVFDPVTLARSLAAVDPQRTSGVAVVALDHPAVRAAIDDLVARGVPVTTLVSDVPSSRRLRYIGIDNSAAGRTAGALMGRFLGSRRGKVALVMGSRGLRDHAERLFGFAQVIAGEHAALQVLDPAEGRDDDARNEAQVGRLLREHPDIVGLYNIGAGNRGVSQALREAGRAHDIVYIAHELTDLSRGLLLDGTLDAVIHQDAGHEVRSSIRVLLAHLNAEPIDAGRERVGIQVYLKENLP
jgi:LacI family transcriptional regulator